MRRKEQVCKVYYNLQIRGQNQDYPHRSAGSKELTKFNTKISLNQSYTSTIVPFFSVDRLRTEKFKRLNY